MLLTQKSSPQHASHMWPVSSRHQQSSSACEQACEQYQLTQVALWWVVKLKGTAGERRPPVVCVVDYKGVSKGDAGYCIRM